MKDKYNLGNQTNMPFFEKRSPKDIAPTVSDIQKHITKVEPDFKAL
jgi:hypothetical protein